MTLPSRRDFAYALPLVRPWRTAGGELASRRGRLIALTDEAGRRVSNLRYAQDRIEKATGIHFTPHDLRRTFATIAESIDVPAYALKRLLNHADGADVTAGYLVMTPERLREPMQRITDFVLKSAGLKPTATVTPIRATA